MIVPSKSRGTRFDSGEWLWVLLLFWGTPSFCPFTNPLTVPCGVEVNMNRLLRSLSSYSYLVVDLDLKPVILFFFFFSFGPSPIIRFFACDDLFFSPLYSRQYAPLFPPSCFPFLSRVPFSLPPHMLQISRLTPPRIHFLCAPCLCVAFHPPVTRFGGGKCTTSITSSMFFLCPTTTACH